MYLIIWHTQSLFCHRTALPITLQLGKYLTSEYEILTNPLGEGSASQTCYPDAWAAAMQFSKSSTLSKDPFPWMPWNASSPRELRLSGASPLDTVYLQTTWNWSEKVKLLEGRPVFLNTSLKSERESVRRQERTQESYRFLSCVKGISTDTCHILTQPMRTTMTDR